MLAVDRTPSEVQTFLRVSRCSTDRRNYAWKRPNHPLQLGQGIQYSNPRSADSGR